jgi:hypothetical protein
MESKPEIEKSSSISRSSIIIFLAVAGVFSLIAIWPFAPALQSLTREDAHVTKVWVIGFSNTTSFLTTSTGQKLSCSYIKGRGCNPETMRALLAKNAPVAVWHNGERVFQIIAKDKVILRYDSVFDGREFAVTAAVISLLVALIQIIKFRKYSQTMPQHKDK